MPLIATETGKFHDRYAQELVIYDTRHRRVWMCALLITVFVVVPVFVGQYGLTLLSLIGIASVGAVSLNLLVGYSGQISLGHAAFAAVGAYSAGVLMSRTDLPFWLAIPAAMIISGLFSLLFGLAALRVKGLYLAIATLAAQYIVDWILHAWNFLGGEYGVVTFEPIKIGPLDTSSAVGSYFLIFVSLALVLIFVENLMRTRTGRAMVAVRDQDLAAAGSGISPFGTKMLAFFLSSMLAGLAGILYGYNAGLVSPEAFSLSLSFQYLAMVLIGGLGTIPGAVLGATFLTLLPIALRDGLPIVGIDLAASIQVHILNVLFGVVILVFLFAEPKGLYGLFRNVKDYFRQWPFSY